MEQNQNQLKTKQRFLSEPTKIKENFLGFCTRVIGLVLAAMESACIAPTMLMSITKLALCMQCHMHSPDNNITDASTRYKITPQPFVRSDSHSHSLLLTCTILIPENLEHKQHNYNIIYTFNMIAHVISLINQQV